jgi:polysaccharide export outer membrane protein
MTSTRATRTSRTILLALVLMLPWIPAFAQTPAVSTPDAAEYEIGIDDVLQVSVWLRPELDRSVTVNARGNIVFPPVGEIRAVGLTPRQLSERVGERLTTYLRQTAAVTVTVVQAYSRSIWVTGAVARPGRFGFEAIPGLLEVIGQAGGAAPNADLARVTIIRRAGPNRGQFSVDLDAALRAGTEEALPPLQAGDVVVVPVAGLALGSISTDAAGVLGAVQRPGIYPVGVGADLWMVLALAGGPSATGNLSGIRVLTRQDDVAQAVRVDLSETLRLGNRSPYVVRPGDIVFVDTKGPSAWGLFTSLLAVTRDVASIVAVIEVLKNK